MSNRGVTKKAVDRESFLQRIWRPAAIGLGLVLTVIWTCALTYGAVELIDELFDWAI